MLECKIGRSKLSDRLGKLRVERFAAQAADDHGNVNLAHDFPFRWKGREAGQLPEAIALSCSSVTRAEDRARLSLSMPGCSVVKYVMTSRVVALASECEMALATASVIFVRVGARKHQRNRSV